MIKKSPVLAKNFKSTFLSTEKDIEAIWKKLFIESRPYSDTLKKLLVIDKPDCLDTTVKEYQEFVQDYNIKELKDDGYISNIPRISSQMFENYKSHILLEFDNFVPTSNSHYRDCTISFTIITPLDIWELDDYKLRPLQIAGYIDGLLNECKLSGIGTLHFMGAANVILDNDFAGINLQYLATHGVDDQTAVNPELPGTHA
jgi:hypothetical protein